MAAVTFTSCEKAINNKEQQDSLYTMTIHFQPYEVVPMTRAAISDFCTHLDIFIVEPSGVVSEYHQTTDDADFGSLTLTLNNQLTYRLVAVAHRCTSPAEFDENVITFPDDKVTHSMAYTTTFTPTKDMVMTCELHRIVAQFQLNTTDAMPNDVKKMQFTVNNVFDRWHILNGGTHQLDRTSVINITSTHDDGTVTCNIYAIVTDESTNHTVTVNALSAADEVLQTKTFQNVPLRNGYRTIATGAFFTDAASTFSFTATDWLGEESYTF